MVVHILYKVIICMYAVVSIKILAFSGERVLCYDIVVSTLARNPGDVGSIPALGTIFHIFTSHDSIRSCFIRSSLQYDLKAAHKNEQCV